MYLARIIGRVVSTVKQDTAHAIPLQWLQPVDASGKERGGPVVAADTFGLGPGELCYFITAREASIALWHTDVAVDAAVVGKVDRLDVTDDATGRPEDG
ncbi:MAG: EutN/CcmL family microcompartment protein [Gemmatimonadetes bacterium]|nr:EutN/CcmL family microcompartment protein [Gemmatimonadota bacterium]